MEEIKSIIKVHEGLRLEPYRCTADKLTIGYGHNLDDKGISQKVADIMLEDDIAEVLSQVGGLPFWHNLSEVRQGVLIDMCFNLGWAGLNNFKNMLSAIEEEDYNRAADEMLDSRWANQVGQRATRLSVMMRTNRWPEDLVGSMP